VNERLSSFLGLLKNSSAIYFKHYEHTPCPSMLRRTDSESPICVQVTLSPSRAEMVSYTANAQKCGPHNCPWTPHSSICAKIEWNHYTCDKGFLSVEVTEMKGEALRPSGVFCIRHFLLHSHRATGSGCPRPPSCVWYHPPGRGRRSVRMAPRNSARVSHHRITQARCFPRRSIKCASLSSASS
jgi:hypothetical protein